MTFRSWVQALREMGCLINIQFLTLYLQALKVRLSTLALESCLFGNSGKVFDMRIWSCLMHCELCSSPAVIEV
jgi:hypothetical protein